MALIHPRPFIGLVYLPRFFNDWVRYVRRGGRQKVRVLDFHPCLGDWSVDTPFDPHYFYQGAWLGRKVRESGVQKHVDVGSSVLTLSVLSAWVDTIFVDYRPLRATLSRLHPVTGDILRLPFPDNAVHSLSCLHVIEHIGLGRYGDPIDPEGSISAAVELQRILQPGGQLFLSLPIGRERVCFNAHRIHSPESVTKLFDQLRLVEFSYVDDEGQLRESLAPSSARALNYGCGLFVFEKP